MRETTFRRSLRRSYAESAKEQSTRSRSVTTSWRFEQARREAAAALAERIVKDIGITAPPVSPFKVLDTEKRRIRVYGDDFGDAFDGRLEYQSPRFLLFYNTKYDDWPH